MANFTEAEQKYIGDTITLAIAQMESKVGSILGQGEAMQTRIQSIVQAHDTALQESSGRTSALVEQVNAASAKLEGYSALINDTDAKLRSADAYVADLMDKLRLFEGKFESQTAEFTRLNSATEAALQGLDEKISNAVSGTRADCQTEFNAVNEKLGMMNTFCAGVKAEVQDMLAHVSGGGGGKGTGFAGFESKGGGKGSGIDRKEVAVWKLPDDVTKVQYRHWSNAVDIQLGAVHAWSGADFVLNRVKRCKEPMTERTFNLCLKEATADVSSDSDIHLDAPSEY
jgi:phage shock protein A